MEICKTQLIKVDVWKECSLVFTVYLLFLKKSKEYHLNPRIFQSGVSGVQTATRNSAAMYQ